MRDRTKVLAHRAIAAIPCKGCKELNYVLNGARPDYHYTCYLKHKREIPSRLGYLILDFLDGLDEPILVAYIAKYLGRADSSTHNACLKLQDIKCIKKTAKGCSITAKGERMLQEWRNRKL